MIIQQIKEVNKMKHKIHPHFPPRHDVENHVSKLINQIDNSKSFEHQQIIKIDNSQHYEVHYGIEYDQRMMMEQMEFSNVLKQSNVTPQLRSKMVDWMLEVLHNYEQTTSYQTFALSVALLDLFIKKKSKTIKDSDIHLSGIATMYIASKYQDIYHIPLSDFYQRVAHKKYSPQQIKKRELEILNSLQFKIYFPTPLKFLNRMIQQNFQSDDSLALQSIKDNCYTILKMCLYDEQFCDYQPSLLAISVLIFSVKSMFFEHGDKTNQDPSYIHNQSQHIIRGILNNYPLQNTEPIEQCIFKLRDLVVNFNDKYPSLKNIQKFTLN